MFYFLEGEIFSHRSQKPRELVLNFLPKARIIKGCPVTEMNTRKVLSTAFKKHQESLLSIILSLGKKYPLKMKTIVCVRCMGRAKTQLNTCYCGINQEIAMPDISTFQSILDFPEKECRMTRWRWAHSENVQITPYEPLWEKLTDPLSGRI